MCKCLSFVHTGMCENTACVCVFVCSRRCFPQVEKENLQQVICLCEVLILKKEIRGILTSTSTKE